MLCGFFWLDIGAKKSDYVGRKKILLLGISGFALSYFVLALFVDGALLSPPTVVVSFAALFAIRGIIGLFYSAIPPVSAALVADKTSPDKRASYMAALGAASGFGMIVGPIAAVHWRFLVYRFLCMRRPFCRFWPCWPFFRNLSCSSY